MCRLHSSAMWKARLTPPGSVAMFCCVHGIVQKNVPPLCPSHRNHGSLGATVGRLLHWVCTGWLSTITSCIAGHCTPEEANSWLQKWLTSPETVCIAWGSGSLLRPPTWACTPEPLGTTLSLATVTFEGATAPA